MLEWTIDHNLMEVTASGKIAKEDYAKILPIIDEMIENYGKPKFLFILHDFDGWKFDALLEDLKYDLKHAKSYGPIAVVGENNWQKWGTKFSGLFTPSEMKFFDKNSINEAKEWIKNQVVKP